MRKIINFQLKLGQNEIENIEIDLKSRDEIPKLLLGLQAIWSDQKIRFKVFEILNELIPATVNPKNGRPGMHLWTILVLGTLRLNCNWDYDKLQETANSHKTLREMLGHITQTGKQYCDDSHYYALQTLKDNVGLFTPEIINKINKVVVRYGHSIIGNNEKLKGSCDSFVVETDVHYPTDINLLFDAARKMIILISRMSIFFGLPGWRQWRHNLKKIKKLFNKVRKLKRSNAKDPEKKAKREELIKDAHQAYTDLVESFVKRIEKTTDNIHGCPPNQVYKIIELESYVAHAKRQIEQIRRRVISGETIPHHEKVFSIFEEHTEWISKGKAGVPQELGLKVCILKDQHDFILHHRVMEHETDDKVAVLMVKTAKEMFPELSCCSFDKGFHSRQNQEDLREILDQVILPKKGKLSKKDKDVEYSEEFIKLRHKHASVESSINGVEQGGLDRCPDHGIDGFKRYVALAVLARNIHRIGVIIQQNKIKEIKKLRKAA